MIIYEFDLASNKFYDTTILTYEIELPPARRKIGFNLLDNEDFTILYIIDKTPNEPAGNQFTTHLKFVSHRNL